jgi:hypothetical protein
VLSVVLEAEAEQLVVLVVAVVLPLVIQLVWLGFCSKVSLVVTLAAKVVFLALAVVVAQPQWVVALLTIQSLVVMVGQVSRQILVAPLCLIAGVAGVLTLVLIGLRLLVVLAVAVAADGLITTARK